MSSEVENLYAIVIQDLGDSLDGQSRRMQYNLIRVDGDAPIEPIERARVAAMLEAILERDDLIEPVPELGWDLGQVTWGAPKVEDA